MSTESDRELLKLAAKPIGFSTNFNKADACQLFKGAEYVAFWNPLTDDGDALRLAVKLRIKFRYNEALGQALAWTGGVKDFESQANIEDCGRDEFACARRAIVRAAAEIGKAMP